MKAAQNRKWIWARRPRYEAGQPPPPPHQGAQGTDKGQGQDGRGQDRQAGVDPEQNVGEDEDPGLEGQPLVLVAAPVVHVAAKADDSFEIHDVLNGEVS